MELRKNDYVRVRIQDIGSEGQGIGKVDGYTLFIQGAVVGDLVEVKIVKSKKNYAFARMEKVLEPSPFRVEPKCSCHRQCGGCQLQTLAYERQLAFKQEKIRNNLIHIGGFTPEYVEQRMEPVIGMDEPFHYRNKAQYPIGTDKEGNPIAGFYAGRTHNIIANTKCWIGAEENQEILECILAYMGRNGIQAYNEVSGTGLVRHVLIRKGFTSGEIMVCLVLNGKRLGAAGNFLPKQEELISGLTGIEGMTSISVSINMERTNVILGKEIHTIWGNGTISDTIHVRDMTKPGYPMTGEELIFHISPQSFYQVNPVQTEKLYSLVREYAALTGHETVWDLYCGIGTISLFLAGKAQKVCGVEVVPQAIYDARENAARNGIRNAEFFVGKAEDVLREYYQSDSCKNRCIDSERTLAAGDEEKAETRGVLKDKETIGPGGLLAPDVIVVDPPRKGCDTACLEAMLRARPERIVYVSCDSATLARDLRVLCDGGYEVEKVRGVDQFGMTVHVETCVLLSRKKSGGKSTKIEIEIDQSEADRRECIGTATYQEIKDYIWEHYRTKVSPLYIAQIKKKCGLDVGENLMTYNKFRKLIS